MEESQEARWHRLQRAARAPDGQAARDISAADHLVAVKELIGKPTDGDATKQFVRQFALVRRPASGLKPSILTGARPQTPPSAIERLSRSLRMLGCVVLGLPEATKDLPAEKAVWITFSCVDSTRDLLRQVIPSRTSSADLTAAADRIYVLRISIDADVFAVAAALEQIAEEWRQHRRPKENTG